MKIVIAVATSDAGLRSYLANNRDKAVPSEIAARGYLCDKRTRFSVQLFAINGWTTSTELGLWLRRLAENTDGLILLIDDDQRHLASDYEDAYFVASLTAYSGRSLQNRVHAILAPILRHFSAYSQRFDNLRSVRVLLLPLNIFLADDLIELRSRMTTRKMMAGLGEDLDRLIAAINRRARPKSKRRFRTVYLVDDRPLYYRYGPERHKIVQTTTPPHHENCWHLSKFRFGRLYDDRLHHNVDDNSDPTCVYGNFTTCHGEVFVAKGDSHLGIFPNGSI
jgi:hypothetical protein